MDWLDRLRQRAIQPALQARWPLYWQGHCIGSLDPDTGRLLDAHLLALTATPLKPTLHRSPITGAVDLRADCNLNQALAYVADALREQGWAGAWRNELLTVTNAQGEPIGAVERGAVRALGVTTHAVHLVGDAPDGRTWVQQRSASKANDPNLWDTLMGGMIGHTDTLDSALARETWEEAGLHLHQLQDLRYGGTFTQQRPSSDGAGGFLHEVTHWYRATVPKGVEPVNQDGEVSQFACLTFDALVAQLKAEQFTLEASLILAQAMGLYTAPD